MPEDAVRHFDRWSRSYEESWRQGFYFDRVHAGVLDAVRQQPGPSSVLDIGCGTGRLLRKIRVCWPDAKVTGVDPAEGMIQKARQLMPEATFIVGPAEHLAFPDSSFDLVVSTVSFHHWSDQLQGVSEVRRVLRNGGHVILADTVLSPFFIKVFHHGHIRTAAGIREIFGQAGLIVISQRKILPWHVLTEGVRSTG